MNYETLTGTVDRIIYENSETGFLIFNLKHKNSSTIVKGSLPAIKAGQDVTILGSWIVHPKFGKQFDAQKCTIALPTNVAGLQKYLSSGIIKGIGPVYATKLINAFGTQVLDVIDQKPEKLKLIDGIGPKRIEKIIEGWQEQKEVASIMIFLQEKNITPAYATKIYKKYGYDSIAVVKENPYRLADEIWGIGFKMADTIAHDLGFTHNCKARIKSGILHMINQANASGHLYIETQTLKSKTAELLGLLPAEFDLIKHALYELYDHQKIKLITEEDTHYITTTPLYYCEKGVADKIKNLFLYPSGLLVDTNAIYQELRIQKGTVQLNEDQQRGIMATLQNKVTIITGGPGTGKTTLICQLLEILDKKRIRYKLAAPTGRAAKRINESTGRSAATLHRLLEFDPSAMNFKRNEENTLETDILIVDEASMIDIFLAHAILKAVPFAAHLIFIGDIDQLPPVGAGNFLRDLIASKKTSCVQLTEIFRQAKNSLIVVNAHRINHGTFPTTQIPDTKKDFIWIKEEQPEKVLGHLQSLFTSRLQKHGISPHDTMVLVPMNRGAIGTQNLNNNLQEIINKQNGKKLTHGATEYKEGDRVMQIRNNYEKMVFNGDLGFIETIQTEDRTISIKFGERILEYPQNELDEIVLAYATTIHKSQGSEYDAVIIPIYTQHFTLLARNLIYTAVTRAKKLCIIIGQTKALAIAIKNNKSIKRQTFLTQMLTTGIQCR